MEENDQKDEDFLDHGRIRDQCKDLCMGTNVSHFRECKDPYMDTNVSEFPEYLASKSMFV